jgi:hypothetical protein
MEKKKKTSNYYFTQETEDAIIEYNASSDPVFRSRIFTQKLYYPFYKMAENIIHTFKFYYLDVDSVEDLKIEIVTLIAEEKIHGFNPSNGAKAFSYFQTIIKRWLIRYNEANYKRLKQVGTFDEMQDSYDSEIDTRDQRVVYIAQVVDEFVELCYNNFDTLFAKGQEQLVADAVLTLFRTRHDLDIFRKKALYIYIREMTDCETPTLTRVVSVLKERFGAVVKSYTDADVFVEYKQSQYL